MAIIKSYTDIDQSKKLAEILPLESADMLWEQHYAEPYVTIKPWTTRGKSTGCHCLSCWSLAALIDVLPNGHSIGKRTNGKYYVCMTCVKHDVIEYDNPVDACYKLILKLNELKLL